MIEALLAVVAFVFILAVILAGITFAAGWVAMFILRRHYAQQMEGDREAQ